MKWTINHTHLPDLPRPKMPYHNFQGSQPSDSAVSNNCRCWRWSCQLLDCYNQRRIVEEERGRGVRVSFVEILTSTEKFKTSTQDTLTWSPWKLIFPFRFHQNNLPILFDTDKKIHPPMRCNLFRVHLRAVGGNSQRLHSRGKFFN